MTEPWLSAEDIAAHLGVTGDSVSTRTAEKNMPVREVGRLWKFQASELDPWLRGHGSADSDRDEAGD